MVCSGATGLSNLNYFVILYQLLKGFVHWATCGCNKWGKGLEESFLLPCCTCYHPGKEWKGGNLHVMGIANNLKAFFWGVGRENQIKATAEAMCECCIQGQGETSFSTNHWSSPSVWCVWKPPQLQGCVIPPLYCGRPHIYKSFNWSLICCFLLTLKYSGCWQPLSSWLSESESFYLCYYKGVESGRGPVWNDLMK